MGKSMLGTQAALLLLSGLALSACVAAADDGGPVGDGDGDTQTGDGDGDTPVGDGDGDAPIGDGDGDTPVGDGDGDGNGDGDGPLPGVRTPLPFAVDGVYVPSGFMGDTESITIAPSETDDNGDCSGDRASAEAVGDCHTVDYANNAAGENWGGIFWQYPDGNWGEVPGLLVAQGATSLTFQAKGAAGGEVVEFLAGMEGTDSFTVSLKETLTTEWTSYTINLSAATYDEVFGSFGFTANGDDNGEAAVLKFYIDNISWN